MAAIEIKLEGVSGAIKAFELMKNATRNRIVRKAARQGNGPHVRAVRGTSLFRDRTGSLRRSVGSIVRTYRQSGVTVAVTGPRKSFVKTLGPTKNLTLAVGKRQVVKPSKYAHLVEHGHAGPRPAPPHPFMARAFASTRMESIDKFTSKFVQETYSEAARAANKV